MWQHAGQTNLSLRIYSAPCTCSLSLLFVTPLSDVTRIRFLIDALGLQLYFNLFSAFPIISLLSLVYNTNSLMITNYLGGDVAQEVELSSGSRRVAGSIPPWVCRSVLSKTPNPQLLLTSWFVPCMADNRCWCVNVCVNG